MLKTGRYVYVVFMCHIAIEKLLKAIVAEITDKTPQKELKIVLDRMKELI